MSALSLPVEHRPQTTRLHPALSCPAVSIFLQLNLKPAVHISLSRSLFHVFLGRPLSLRPCGVHCSTCLRSVGIAKTAVYSVLQSLSNVPRWSVGLVDLLKPTPSVRFGESSGPLGHLLSSGRISGRAAWPTRGMIKQTY